MFSFSRVAARAAPLAARRAFSSSGGGGGGGGGGGAVVGLAIGGAVAAGVISQQPDLIGLTSDSESKKTIQAMEDKFADYWPRNVMILFGPPVSSEYHREKAALVIFDLHLV